MEKSSVNDNTLERWVEEKHPQHFGIRYRVKEVLFTGQSDFQK